MSDKTKQNPKSMELKQISDELYQVLNCITKAVLYEGNICDCEDFMYCVHLRLTGI